MVWCRCLVRVRVCVCVCIKQEKCVGEKGACGSQLFTPLQLFSFFLSTDFPVAVFIYFSLGDFAV